MYNSQLAKRRAAAYNKDRKKKERSVINTMLNKFIMGDLDDMIFADCDWQPSER